MILPKRSQNGGRKSAAEQALFISKPALRNADDPSESPDPRTNLQIGPRGIIPKYKCFDPPPPSPHPLDRINTHVTGVKILSQSSEKGIIQFVLEQLPDDIECAAMASDGQDS